MRELTIQIATHDDLEVVASLLLQSNRHYWGVRDDAKQMTRSAAEKIVGGESGCRIMIARIEDVPAAFATFTILHPAQSENGTLFLKDLFVAESARGTGVGREIMRHMAQMAVEWGCLRFDWTAEKDNPGALRFYDELGALRVEEKVYFRLAGQELQGFASGPE